MAWLARIADREIVDRADYHHRQRRDAGREAPIDDHPELTARVRSVLSQVILDEQARGATELEAALDSLSDAHRQIILLRKFEELSFKRDRAPAGKVRGRLPHAAGARDDRPDAEARRAERHMSDLARELEPLFARFVEEHVLHGRVLAAADLCGPRVDLIAPLDRLIERYQSITVALDGGLARAGRSSGNGRRRRQTRCRSSRAFRPSNGSARAAWARSSSCGI